MNSSTYSSELRFRVLWIISKQQRDFSILLLIAGVLLSFGFFFGLGTNENYQLIYSFGGTIFWGSLFAIYSIIRVLDLVTNIPRWLSVICGMVGIWAWNYIFLSFVVFDTSPMAPTEILLMLPTIAEFWALIRLPSTQYTGKKIR